MAPDSSGRRAAMCGEIQVKIPSDLIYPGIFHDQEYISSVVGETVMTGPDRGEFSVVWYGLKRVEPVPPFYAKEQVVLIGVSTGQARFIAPGKMEVTHHMAFYRPDQDADQDGLPDPGEVPALCLPVAKSIDTQPSLIPPCTPPQ